MSRTTLRGNQPRSRLRVGIETRLPQPSLYGCVLDLGEHPHRHVLAPLGKIPNADVLVKVGASTPPLRDVQEIVAALAPYGSVPLPLQLTLLEELDALAPFLLSELGKCLVVVCQQDARAGLMLEPSMPENPVVMLTAQGWQTRPWSTVAQNPRPQLSHVLFPNQQAALDAVNAFEHDLSLLLYLHEEGLARALPVCALLAHGAAVCGFVIVAQDAAGLSAYQLQVVQQERFFVPVALQPR